MASDDRISMLAIPTLGSPMARTSMMAIPTLRPPTTCLLQLKEATFQTYRSINKRLEKHNNQLMLEILRGSVFSFFKTTIFAERSSIWIRWECSLYSMKNFVMALQWSWKLLEIVDFWLANAGHFQTFSKKACCLWTPAPPILPNLPFQFPHSPTETEEAQVREESTLENHSNSK